MRTRKMFGGLGIYLGDAFFGICDDDQTFFKVDEQTVEQYENRGMGPWIMGGEINDKYRQVPEEIMADRALCRDRATDFPTVTVTVYRAAGSKRVVDYRGCAPDPAAEARLERLRALEAAVDSAAGSSRWARPAGRS